MALDTKLEHRIRILIPDTEAIYGDAEDEYMFSAEDVEALYEEGFGNSKCAAGLAKIQIGSSEALILKVVKNYETTVNGAALMREWVRAGQALYDMGLAEVADEDAGEGMFEIAFPEPRGRHPEGMSHGSYRMGGWL